MAVAAHQREQAAVARARRIDLPPAGQEMMIDKPDDMETIGHDLGLGKMLAHQRTIVGGEVHAHHADLGLAFQTLKIGLQSQFRTAEHDVIDLTVSQIAEGRGKTLAAGEEVFVYAQYLRAARWMQLGRRAVGAAL